MGFSATLRLPSTSCYSKCNLVRNQQRSSLLSSGNQRPRSLLCIRSIASRGKRKIDSNGAAEPTRNLLNRLFAQAQRLEEKMSKDSQVPQNFLIGMHLETLESDLQSALAALKKKEEDLQEAERKVLLEHGELKRAKEGLQRREGVISEALSRQEKLEEELKLANSTLATTAREMEELKLLVKEKEQEIATAKLALCFKEEEMEKMETELVSRNEEAISNETELKSKVQILDQANAVIVKQEVEIQELRNAIAEKEEELKASFTLRMVDEGKLKEAEAKLEKQATEWVLAQQELMNLAEEASKHEKESYKTLEDFRRVKILLEDIRSELITSQKSLACSQAKMEEHERLLDEQLGEVERQKQSILSYMKGLKDAQIEVETEKVKVRVAEARNKELERDLSLEKELMNALQLALIKEKSSLQQATEEKCHLQSYLDIRNTEFVAIQENLRAKELELVEARLEIQHLKSEQAALILILEERDVELSDARRKLEELNSEVEELKALLVSREKQLIQATEMLKEKDEHVQSIQHELQDTELKFAEAESVVQRITELTTKLVSSIKDDDYSVLNPPEMDGKWLLEHSSDLRWKGKQLEAEMGLTRQTLREKEMELLESQRVMAVKDEELRTVLNKLEEREKEICRLKQEMMDDASDLRKLYELAQERIGEKTMGDHAIEKLQLESAQLEVEAATSALQKLTEMSRELLTKTNLNSDSDSEIILWRRPDLGQHNECFIEVQMAVERLSALSEQFVREAGISVGTD